jgi:hypothetical protein
LFSENLRSGYSRFNGEFDIPEKVDLIVTYVEYRYKICMEQYKFFRNDLKKLLQQEKTVWIPALFFNRTQKVLYGLKRRMAAVFKENTGLFCFFLCKRHNDFEPERSHERKEQS